MSNFNREEVVSVHHWTDTLFSFRTTRNPTFRFRNGQFTMIGLEVQGRPLLRAFTVPAVVKPTSANTAAHLSCRIGCLTCLLVRRVGRD